MSQPMPKMNISLTRGEAQRLHEELGDIPRAKVGPKLFELYRHLDAVMALEWNEKNLKKQQRRSARL